MPGDPSASTLKAQSISVSSSDAAAPRSGATLVKSPGTGEKIMPSSARVVPPIMVVE